MIAINLTEQSRANLEVAERIAVLRIEPSDRRGDRWVLRVSLGERTTYLSDEEGIALFSSVDSALRFAQATRSDLIEGVEVGELRNVKAAGRPDDPAAGTATPGY